MQLKINSELQVEGFEKKGLGQGFGRRYTRQSLFHDAGFDEFRI